MFKDRRAVIQSACIFVLGLLLAVAGKILSERLDSPVWAAGLYLSCMMFWILSVDILTDAMPSKR